MGAILDFLGRSTPITLLVISWLCLYFFITIWLYIYKSISIRAWISKENQNLDALLSNPSATPKNPMLNALLLNNNNLNSDILNIWKTKSLQQATQGLVVLSIIASTAPFIGLFGTVVEILDAFSHLGAGVSFEVIAPIISKALVATACGILAAIPAYSFYLLLKRKIYNLGVCMQMQINLMLSANRKD